MSILITQHIVFLSLLAVIMPLLTFFINVFIPGRFTRSGFFAIASIAISLLCSLLVFIAMWNEPFIHVQTNWFTIGSWSLDVGILLNNLSVLMLPLVSGIALLVHIYSTKYMQGDPYLHRYWAYLGLFCFSMLGLVIADNLLLIYMCWELVGFSSYLLIGFWFTRNVAVQANKKAFIMNRLGDIGFLTGIMIMFSQFQTLDIISLFGEKGLVSHAIVSEGIWISGMHHMPAGWLTFAGLAFFLGAVAKSAQFPLHTWLPDAMEGPTSVSSLIHAATMVAAGVFLLARIYPLFNDTVLVLIAATGAFTAFMAGTIALTQNDIKRILAFSTISQLGFMILAMGVGASASSLFHLGTHAFFKCLLFLGAGAIIHEMVHLKEKTGLEYDPQDIRNMGGLRKYMPVTFITMAIGSLALIAIPLTSGYLSKDAILIESFEWAEGKGGWYRLVPYSAMITSWLTAFYISRLIFKVFFGEFRLKDTVGLHHVHEAAPAMKYVLVVLSLFCLFPVFSLNPLLFEDAWVIQGFPQADSMTRINAFHTVVPAAVNLISVFLIYLCFSWYGSNKPAPDFSKTGLFKFSQHQWFFDKAYNTVFVAGVLGFSRFLYWFDLVIVDGIVNLFGAIGRGFARISDWFDRNIIDGLVNLIGYLAGKLGKLIRNFQTGRLQQYLVTMLLIILTLFIYKYYTAAI
ncbi:NADH-quinone oxidoreductase subunit L [Arcticibacter eurypsychrophilus]|uniref:NADH-quinone oxidoreductase subunit L n=1 Tax=Arcticibacter eurypsychrophilus TaxID=1434752 RepID=UPI0021CD2AA5|nr:NADH-quinone oxidoreductase subunit L [Arcticibacter eurypsychrophilus]